MIYIGLPQWSHPKWVRLGITGLEEYARHFNCVEGIPRSMPYQRPRSSNAGTSKPTMTFVFVLNSRQPFRIRRRCATAMIYAMSFSPVWRRWNRASVSTGYSYLPPSARATSLPCGVFSRRYRKTSLTASKFATLSFSAKVTPNSSLIAGCISVT